MRINVVCIYWFLLCVSIISSCLLFILVASETEKFSSAVDKPNLQKIEINTTHADSKEGIVENTEARKAVSEEGVNLKSSFKDVNQDSQDSEANSAAFGFGEHLPQNSGVSEGYSDTNGVIFTLVDTASVELQQKAESTLEPNTVEEKNTSTITTESREAPEKTEFNVEVTKDEVIVENKSKPEETKTEEVKVIVNDTQIDQKVNISEENNSKEEHDIPSFSEWTQKQLEEAEKKKEKGNISSNSQNVVKNINNLKLRSKNYASPDCGAKIVAANPEAVSAGSVLSPSRDEYKLNTCTSRIWFIVELCEAIQAKKIDLANFELFSSSPKDFVVSVSDRFPSREWSSVGQFTAKDERDIQSFNLHPHLFGKFIKVEMLSHYGSEHFCPISLFRVYGTSEFEVLETEDQVQTISDEDDDDETLDSYSGEPANNLFGSARDAVMSIVKKAAEVLVKGADSNQTEKEETNTTKYTPLINSCTTPSRIIVCDNCSELLFGNVFQLMSCKGERLKKLLDLKTISHLLYNTDICIKYGLNFSSKSIDTSTSCNCGYVSSFFPPKYLAALCNVLAIIEHKVVLNTSSFANVSTVNITQDIVNIETKQVLETLCPTDTTTEAKTCTGATEIPLESSIPPTDNTLETLEIKPTKTLARDENIQEPSINITELPIEPTALEPSENIVIPNVQNTIQKNLTEEVKTVESSASVLPEESAENFEIGNEQLDKLLSELNLESESTSNVPTTIAPPSNVPQAQKESVFLRLSSRIKALERNMSLSGQYLEELSRRYKKQVEEMQKAFEKKLLAVNEEIKRRDDREAKMQEQLTKLSDTLNSLLSEREGFWKTAGLISQFLFMEIFVACVLIYLCCRSPEERSVSDEKVKTVVKKRRQSIDAIGHETPVVKRSRRPSEEALRIAGTYEDLLIENDANWPLTKAEKRRRRKRNALLRTQSIIEQREKTESLKRSSSFDINSTFRKQSAPAQMYVNGDVSPPVKMQDLPFALEESEHTTVEPMPYDAPDAKTVVKNGGVKATILKSSPTFMKTALSSRSKRNSGKLSLFKTDKVNGKADDAKKMNRNDDSSQRRSPDPSIGSNNISDSNDDRSSVGSVSVKKEKKSGGFKKIFKKVFE